MSSDTTSQKTTKKGVDQRLLVEAVDVVVEPIEADTVDRTAGTNACSDICSLSSDEIDAREGIGEKTLDGVAEAIAVECWAKCELGHHACAGCTAGRSGDNRNSCAA